MKYGPNKVNKTKPVIYQCQLRSGARLQPRAQVLGQTWQLESPKKGERSAGSRTGIARQQNVQPSQNRHDHEAVKIMRALATGTTPETGEHFEADPVYGNPKVVNALNRVLSTLVKQEERERFRPTNTGGSWRWEEVAKLFDEVHQGLDFREIAQRHNRSVGSIVAGIIKLGTIRPPPAKVGVVEEGGQKRNRHNRGRHGFRRALETNSREGAHRAQLSRQRKAQRALYPISLRLREGRRRPARHTTLWIY